MTLLFHFHMGRNKMTKLQQSLMILLSTGAIIIIFGFLYYYDSIKETNHTYEEVVEMDNDTLVEESENDSSTFTTSFVPPPTTPTLYEPFIGMTDYETLKSTWGKPSSINKTETAYSIKEQWVYPNWNNLYFEDEYLYSIDSSN